jgi:hypothetical protein
MTKVLDTKEYKALEAKHSNELEMTLTKSQSYKLKPFGRFTIKWKTNQRHLPNIIPYDEVRIKYDTTMPTKDDQDKTIIKFMLKHKTDVLTDGRDFYTRAGTGFTEISHNKISDYKTFLYKKELDDSPESWATYVESLKNY